MMDDESLSGEGDVYVKKTREAIGRFHYSLKTYRRDGGRLRHTDAEIALDAANGRRFWSEGVTLVLRTKERRYLDFFVSRVSGDHIEVTATGGLRDEM